MEAVLEHLIVMQVGKVQLAATMMNHLSSRVSLHIFTSATAQLIVLFMLLELGIKPEEIKKKFLAILTQRGFKEVTTYEDMAGAMFVLFLFGILLLCRGTYQFGNIYGAGSSGCVSIFLIINLLTKKGVYVELYSTISILGYSLLPFCFLAAGSIMLDLHSVVGVAFCTAIIAWSTITATRFFENNLDMQDQRYLIAYPIFLFYCVFNLLVIF